MENSLERLTKQPVIGAICLITVFCGLALGHSLVVLQHDFTGGPTALNTAISAVMGIAGFTLVWIGLNKPEAQATVLGYIGGNLIWIGVFEWVWLSFAHWMNVEGIYDRGMLILSPELLIIQATGLIMVAMLIFLGANKDTRCRMFMWFHRNLKLRPGRQTPGYKRQHARNTAIETVFLIWTIYQFAILINDPRLIGYDSVAAMVITVGFVIWGLYLANKLFKIRGVGPTLRYAIPAGAILWLPIEAFSRWGLYPEIWIKPAEYSGIMTMACVVFIILVASFYLTDRQRQAASA
ncbi:MAG: hypothetical protein HKN81_02340 [Gammaproteobacteria bacterium]|nr:hypothetical protein [Gammaproteobacteria bacterium]